MKILLSYSSESDKGEGRDFVRVLRRLGHEVTEVNVAAGGRAWPSNGPAIRGYPPEAGIDDLISDAGGADLLLYVEPFGLVPYGLDRSPIPTACVISDVHRKLQRRIELAAFFDHVFLYQRNYMSHFSQHQSDAVHWWPWSCDPCMYFDPGVPRDLDVAFVGQLHPGTPRERIVRTLATKYSVNEPRVYHRDEIPAIYGRSKIVINLPLSDDLNWRFFEAMSCGAMLLTSRADNGQAELFRDGEQFVSYADESDLLQKVDYFLAHPEDCARIARAGYDEVRRNHTLDIRLHGLLEQVRAGPHETAPIRRAGRAEVVSDYARLWERTGRVESLLRLAADPQLSTTRRVRFTVVAARAFAKRLMKSW